MLERRYFTFGSQSAIDNYYAVVELDTDKHTNRHLTHREVFMDTFGSKFAFEYDSFMFDRDAFNGGCLLYITENNFGQFKNSEKAVKDENQRHLTHRLNRMAAQ